MAVGGLFAGATAPAWLIPAMVAITVVSLVYIAAVVIKDNTRSTPTSNTATQNNPGGPGNGGGPSQSRPPQPSGGGGGSRPPSRIPPEPKKFVPPVIAGYQVTKHAAERIAGSRGDGGMTKWAVETIIKYGKDVSASSGTVGKEIESLGKVVLSEQGRRIVTAWPYGTAAAGRAEDWLVKTLVDFLTGQ